MREISEETVSKIIGRIYRDTLVAQQTDNFVMHTYKPDDFEGLADGNLLHSVLGFLPNVNYRGAPFVMSVVYDKRLKHYEITVHNPNY